MSLAAVELHSAQEVLSHAREVQARIRASYGPSNIQLSAEIARRELETTKAERDQYRARCVLLEETNRHLATVLAKEPADKIAKALPARIDIKTIIRVVAESYNIKPIEILSDRRTMDIVEPRHVAIYLARILTRFSLPQIGKHFGGRDHTTCLHAFQKIELRRQADEIFDGQMKGIMARFVIA